MDKLNLGCGRINKSGYVNFDIVSMPEVDIVGDMDEGLPFLDNSFSEVLASHILEHSRDLVRLMAEIWSVTKFGGVLEAYVPWWSYPLTMRDPTHRIPFCHTTFDPFCDDDYDHFHKVCGVDGKWHKLGMEFVLDKEFYLPDREKLHKLGGYSPISQMKVRMEKVSDVLQGVEYETHFSH